MDIRDCSNISGPAVGRLRDLSVVRESKDARFGVVDGRFLIARGCQPIAASISSQLFREGILAGC
jgi:hypothetical protein